MSKTTPDASPSARLVAILAVATALGPFAMQVFLPALPSIQTAFGVDAATAQLVFSLSGIAMAVATLVYGPISDSYGRRPTILAGIVIFLVGSALCAWAPTIEYLVLGRVVQAAGGAAGMVLSRAIIRDTYERDVAAAAIAYVTMAMVAAPMIAPALGGVLVQAQGWRSVFLAGGIAGALVLPAIWMVLAESHPKANRGSSETRAHQAFAVLLRQRLFVAYMAQGAFSMSVFFAFLAAAPHVIQTILGLSSAEYGIMFMLVSGSFMAGNYLSTLVGTRMSVDLKILLGSIGTMSGTTIALLLLLLFPWSIWSVFLPMMLTATAQGVAMPNSQAAVVSVRPELAGAASGLAGFGQMVVASLVAQTVGSLQTGTPYPMAIGMLLCAAGMLVAAIVARRC